MHIVLGGTGHTGSAVAQALLDAGEPVTVVTRDGGNASHLHGAVVAEVDVLDVEALRAVFRTGRRAFLLNPPGDPSGDPDADERRSGAAIAAALDGSGLEAAVAQSTYGTQAGQRIGDLGTLHAFEEALNAQPIPVLIQRVAYLMSNWEMMLEPAKAEGKLPTLFPADFEIPMVSPDDVGRIAARHLRAERVNGAVVNVEGPAHYSPHDVAKAFAAALGRDVAPEAIPREDWKGYYTSLGFSDAGAESFTGMTELTADAPDWPARVIRGDTTIADYVRQLVGAAPKPN